MKVVPEDVLTCPLGTVREPQSTAVENMNTVDTDSVYTVIRSTTVADPEGVLWVKLNPL